MRLRHVMLVCLLLGLFPPLTKAVTRTWSSFGVASTGNWQVATNWSPAQVPAVGFSIGTFGVIARFVLPHADDASFTLSFIVPMGVCIAVFVLINRNDPEVTG